MRTTVALSDLALSGAAVHVPPSARDVAGESTPRVRLMPLPDDGVLVVRGDELDADVLVEDATRFHDRYSAWGRFGISAFIASSEGEVDALCEARLVRFAEVVVFQ